MSQEEATYRALRRNERRKTMVALLIGVPLVLALLAAWIWRAGAW
jgi:hypothetical protein